MGNKMMGADKPLDLAKKGEPTVSHIFRLTADKLKLMYMPASEENLNEPLDILKKYGYAKGVLHKLATDSDSGIIGDDRDLKRRRRYFGANIKPLAPVPKVFDSIKQTIMEPLWLVMIISAILSSICSMFVKGFFDSLGDAIAIITAAILLILITAGADWAKDRRFVQLQAIIKEDKVTVIRGKSGATSTISVWDLVVGDVILLNTGAQVPADCLVLTAADLQVSPPKQGVDGNPIHKKPFGGVGYDVDSDPFLLSGSMVTRGQCKALVCCVGKESTLGEESVDSLGINEDTALQKKLKNLTDQFTLGALYSAIIIFVVLIIRSIIQSMSADAEAGLLTKKIAESLNIAVVLIVVSVPEGLPLTIGVSLAFSVMKMYSEKILVRKLDAPERMGGIDEICCGKTATLTKNKMRVAQFYSEGKHIRNTRKDTFVHCDLSQEAMTRIKESILYNVEAKVEMDDTTYVPVGNGTEVGLLKFLQDADIPIHLQLAKKNGRTKMISPHTPERKRSATAVECPDREGRVVIYVKGAPEIILEQCRDMLCTDPQISADGRSAELGANERATVIEKIEKMAGQAGQPLRVLGFAFWEMDKAEWEQVFERDASRSADRAFEEMMLSGQTQLTWIGAIGLKDSLRQGVTESIRFAREKASLGIRLVSGDHIKTAQQVAVESGILLPHETAQPYAVMTGEAFRGMVGTIQRTHNPTTDQTEETIEHLEAFTEIQEQLRVLARATPFDKAILVRGLKCLGKNVAVTGDGISDVDSLKISDAGLAMGSGCSAAIHNSDLVLTDDDFEATIQAIKWGRNIFHNVSRFLQFQVTVNISVLFVILFGAIIIGESPFNAVQLLWINAIMDTFAAIALSTEPPVDSVIDGRPFKGNAAVLSASVWRQILGISVWNVMVIVFQFISMICNEKYIGGADASWIGDANKTGEQQRAAQFKLERLTEIFHIFVFLQIFNQINCRKVGRQDFNVFEEFGHNFFFLAILVITIAIQVLLGTTLYTFAGITPWQLNNERVEGKPSGMEQWGNCIAIGFTNLIAAAVLKMLPTKFVDFVGSKLPDSLVNEDREVDNKTLKAWDKMNQMPTGRKGQDDYYDQVDDESAGSDERADNDFQKA